MNYFNIFNILLECKSCKNILESPVVFPCGESICKKHLNDTDKEYFCISCQETHIKPSNGFPPNKIAQSLLETRILEFCISEHFQNAHNSCKALEKSFSNFESIQQNPNNYIDLFVDKLKNKIDLKREESKLEFEKATNNLIESFTQLQDLSDEDEFNRNALEVSTSFKKFMNTIKPIRINKSNFEQELEKYIEEIKERREIVFIDLDETCVEFVQNLESFKTKCVENLPNTKKFNMI